MASDLNKTRQNGSDSITTIALQVAASANSLALAQAVNAAGAITLNGALIVAGAYTGTGARRLVAVSTSAGDNTQSVTFVGTDRWGNALSEIVALNGTTTVTTVNDFLTVTSIVVSALMASNITAGTSSVASGAWITIERAANGTPNISGVARLVSGAANFTVEETYDDINASKTQTAGALFPYETDPVTGLSIGANVPPAVFSDTVVNAVAATTQFTINQPFWAFRLTVNSGTGIVQMQAASALMPIR